MIRIRIEQEVNDMLKPKYRYMVFSLADQKTPVYVGTAKEIAKKLYIDSSCIHKAAKKRKVLMKRYLISREEIR